MDRLVDMVKTKRLREHFALAASFVCLSVCLPKGDHQLKIFFNKISCTKLFSLIAIPFMLLMFSGFANAVPAGTSISNTATAGYTVLGSPQTDTDTVTFVSVGTVTPSLVFDSASGLPINGAQVTLIDNASGLPATVLGDDGISVFPSTITSGGSVTDSGGTVYNFGPGRYRFPIVAAGNYRLDITAAGYSYPTTVTDPVLQALPGAPYTLVVGSRGEVFANGAGALIDIDVPLDPGANAQVLLTKTANKSVTAVGEYVKYELTIDNSINTLNLLNVTVTDTLPRGFRYQQGSAKLNGVSVADPVNTNARTLVFSIPQVNAGDADVLSYVVHVTAGANRGDAVNRAVAVTGSSITSNEATATVVVRDELHRSEAFLIGRVIVNSCSPTGETGLPNARIYLEDGTSVLTDEEGKWHIEGVKPGTHVVQLDLDSLPAGAEVIECEPDDSRHADQPWSRFVDVRGGTLWRTDFYVRAKQYTEEQKVVLKKIRRFFFDFNSDDIKPEHQAELAELTEILKTSGLGIKIDGHTDDVGSPDYNQRLSQRRADAVKAYLLKYGLTEQDLNLGAYGADSPFGENVSELGRSLNRRVDITSFEEHLENVEKIEGVTYRERMSETKLSESHIYDSRWLQQQDGRFEIVYPTEGFNPPLAALHVGVKHHPQYKVKLLFNGNETHPLDFIGNEQNFIGTTSMSRWKGMSLETGDNLVEAILMDRSGKEVDRISRKVHFSDVAVKAELVPEKSRLVADGKSSPIVAIRFTDRFGKPARKHSFGEFSVDAPYQAAETVNDYLQGKIINATSKPQFFVRDDGIAYIALQPTTQSGEARVRFYLEDEKEEEIDLWLSAEQRDWIFVGLAEASLHQHMDSGDSNNLEQSIYYSDTEEGRVAFFARGQIKGEWLLTAAYDSDKDTNERFKRVIDPDEYYTLYGDDTIQQYDAVSSKKLYLKLERRQFYAMLGDYDTNMADAEFARYSRSATGIKSELKEDNLRFKFFVAEADFSYHRDEIRGDGTSGLYRLSNDQIVMNSESITIEVRERLRSEKIISSTRLVSHVDYNIDYDEGTIFFRSPVLSNDAGLNPVYIVAEYETEGGDSSDISGGGRVAYHLDEETYVGVTAVREGNKGAEGDLYGVDASWEINESLVLKSEVVTSEQEDPTGDRDGNAYLMELNYTSDNINSSVYYREQEDGFGLGQQNASENGTRKTGAQLAYKLGNDTSVQGEIYQQEHLVADTRRNVMDATLHYDDGKKSAYVGIREAQDEDALGDKYSSTQLLLGAIKRFLNNKLTLRLDSEFLLQDSNEGESSDYPNRVAMLMDYKLTDWLSVFGKQEQAWGEYEEYQGTAMGLSVKPWRGAETRSSVERQIDENGYRTFSNMGMTQQWVINRNWTADFSLERSQTLDEATYIPVAEFSDRTEDFNAVSAALSYVTQVREWTARIESRDGDDSDRFNFVMGYLQQLDDGLAVSTGLSYTSHNHSSGDEDTSGDLRFSVAYRPAYSPWTIFNRTDYLYDVKNTATTNSLNRRLVNNLIANYKADNISQYSFQYGGKYVLDKVDGEHYDGYVDLYGFEYRRSLRPTKDRIKWDVGMHANALNSWDAGVHEYSTGVSMGMSPQKNMWITAGYNFTGFRDDDFSGSEFTDKGFYLKFRMKFDQESLREMWERAVRK